MIAHCVGFHQFPLQVLPSLGDVSNSTLPSLDHLMCKLPTPEEGTEETPRNVLSVLISFLVFRESCGDHYSEKYSVLEACCWICCVPPWVLPFISDHRDRRQFMGAFDPAPCFIYIGSGRCLSGAHRLELVTHQPTVRRTTN